MTRRTDRVAEAVQALVAELLLREIKDPRIGMVTITAVKITPDLRHARIFFSCMGDDAQRVQSQKGLTSAAGFVRAQVARRLGLRVAPQIAFEYDSSFDEAERVARLIKDARARDSES